MRIEPDFKPISKLENEIMKLLKRSFVDALKEIRNVLSSLDAKGFLNQQEINKYNRFASLEQEITDIANELYKENRKTLNSGLSDIFAESYYRTAYTLEYGIQANLSFALLDPQFIANAIQNPIAGLTLNQRLEAYRKDIIRKTSAEIAAGAARGDSYSVIARNIKDIYEGDLNKARRIARTETGRAQEDARNKAYQRGHDLGVNMKKVWMSTLDSRTRDTHRKMDGQTVGMDEMFKTPRGTKGLYPKHFIMGAKETINCRCTHVVEVEGFRPEFRRARDETGQNKVIPYATYEEWEKNKLRA